MGKIKEKIKKECLMCGKKFMVRPCDKKRKYCSRRCWGEWRSKNTRGKNSPSYKGKIVKKCLICGVKFEVYPSKKNRKHCSNECNWKRLAGLTGEKALSYKEKIIKRCPICGVEFKVPPSDKDKKYCSVRCYREWTSKNKITVENRQSKRKSTEYKQWRTKVFEGDDFTCVCCEKRGLELQVHHLTNFASLYDKEDYLLYDTDNGITLCKKCHMEFHRIYGTLNNDNDQVWEFVSNVCLS